MFCPRCRRTYSRLRLECRDDRTRLLPSADVGDYRIEGHLDDDRHGARYRASHARTGRAVRLQLLDVSALGVLSGRVIERRVAAIAALHSKHVVRIIDTGIVGDYRFVVTEPAAGHTFADELGAVIPLARIQFVMEGVLAGLAVAHDAQVRHGALQPWSIVLAPTPDGEVPMLTGFDLGEPDPYMLAPGQLVERFGEMTDVHAFGVLLFETLENRWVTEDSPPVFRRAEVPRPVRELVLRCLDDGMMRGDGPIVRPDHASIVLDSLVTDRLVPLGSRVPTWPSTTRPDEPAPISAVATTLFESLRSDPSDQATRQVYADWLEQHGHATRASFLRLDAIEDPDEDEVGTAATPGDAGWRAVISRAPIAKCVTLATRCPKRWDALAPTPTDGVRHCTTCAKSVYFCATIEEARHHGARRDCVAIDAALTREAAVAAYALSDPPELWVGEMAVEPEWTQPEITEPIEPIEPIIPQPPESGFLARLRERLLRR